MGREIYNIINDMAEVLNASQMQKLQAVLINRLSENTMSDFLLSTGIRVGELVRLNINDIDFSEREGVVYGKGD